MSLFDRMSFRLLLEERNMLVHFGNGFLLRKNIIAIGENDHHCRGLLRKSNSFLLATYFFTGKLAFSDGSDAQAGLGNDHHLVATNAMASPLCPLDLDDIACCAIHT